MVSIYAVYVCIVYDISVYMRTDINMKRILKEIPILESDLNKTLITTKVNVLEVSLEYSKGGMNYFTSSIEKRGIYLHVTPLQKGDRWTAYVGFSGVKQLWKPLQRFSQKQLNECVVPDTTINNMIKYVVNKHNLKLQNL